MRGRGICTVCLVSIELLTCGSLQTPCCAKGICTVCFERVTHCAVCRTLLDKTVQPSVQSVAVPPPYFGFSVEGELRAAELPAYGEDPQARSVVSVGAATSAGSSGGVVPARQQDIAELRTGEDGVYVIHYISPRDTLVGISLKYNVKVDDIRQANRLYTSAIHGREHLVIPGVPGLPKFTEDPPDEMKAERERQRRVKRFQVATKCVEPAEATYYIETNAHDVDAAIKQYLADLEWERAHPLPGGKHAPRPGRAAAAAAAIKRTASAPMPVAAASPSATSLAAFNLFAPIGASSSSSASVAGSSSAPHRGALSGRMRTSFS